METGEPTSSDVLLGRRRNPGVCDSRHFDWQRVLKNSVRAAAGALDRDVAHGVSLLRIDSAAFPRNVVSIRRQGVQSFHPPARPPKYDLVRFRRLAQTEMQPQVALRNVAIAAANFLLALVGALLECDRCAQ